MPNTIDYQQATHGSPCYHCSSRYVRRAYHWGASSITEKPFEKRHQWIEDRIAFLSSVFAIRVSDYQVMRSHYSVTLYMQRDECNQWSKREVCARALRLFKGNFLTQKFRRGELLDALEYRAIQPTIAQWRLDLCDVSLFMRMLNQPFVEHIHSRRHEADRAGAMPSYDARLTVH